MDLPSSDSSQEPPKRPEKIKSEGVKLYMCMLRAIRVYNLMCTSISGCMQRALIRAHLVRCSS